MPDEINQTDLLCDSFYQLVEPLGRDPKGRPIVQPGQLIWAHQVYPTSEAYVIQVEGYDPRDQSRSSYVIRRLHQQGPPALHFPIKELGLRADENYYILYGKKRPGVVLQVVATSWLTRLYPEPYALVLPAFTFKQRHNLEFRYRVAAMEFPHLFYVPAHPDGFSEAGVLRLELVQPVATAAVEPVFKSGRQSLLSEEAWAILQHQLMKFVAGKVLDNELEETLRAYRDLVLEAYRSGGSPGSPG